MEFTRILAAVNLLDGRDAALERALTLARASGAELYLLHAVPVDRPFSFRAAERLDRIADLRKRAADAGVRAHTVEQHGDAAEIIELHADSRAADLIVMGGEARRGWRRRSAVAERVVRRTNVPVLVVAGDSPDNARDFRNVLVALDLSPASKHVLGAALALTSGEAMQLTVMHTVDQLEAVDAVHSAARWKVPEYRTYVLEDARRELEAVASMAPGGLDARVQLSTGSAARTILEHAGRMDADLVVVGRSRGFKVLGSTALRVLRKSNRALLVIPTSAHQADRDERQLAA